MKVTARAQRSGGWWAVDVPEVPGVFTQVRRLDQVADQVAAAVATMLEDITAADVEVSLDAKTAFAQQVEQALLASEEAARAQARASGLMRQVVHGLRTEEALSVRDVATLLGVSHQRVSQLSS